MEDQEKNDIQDAQISEVGTTDKKIKNKNYHTEIILIFIIGLLLGVMVKAEALKKVSMGFSDYKVSGGTQGYDLDEIEKQVTEKMKKEQSEAPQPQVNQEVAPQAGE